MKQPERLGVCLDTAHFFAAGYDIRKPKGWDTAIDEVEKMIGLDQVLAFHERLEDRSRFAGRPTRSHRPRVDRHAFKHIVNDARFADTDRLETPKSPDLHEDVENLNTFAPFEKGRAKKKRT